MGSDPVFPGCMVEVRPVAMLQMIDGGDADFKILAVQTENPRYEHIKNLPDVEAHNNHLLKEIAHFMKVYKELQGKEVQVMGWQNVQKAHEEIRKAQKAFLEESK
jgi:inorganic pyrophosphatase